MEQRAASLDLSDFTDFDFGGIGGSLSPPSRESTSPDGDNLVDPDLVDAIYAQVNFSDSLEGLGGDRGGGGGVLPHDSFDISLTLTNDAVATKVTSKRKRRKRRKGKDLNPALEEVHDNLIEEACPPSDETTFSPSRAKKKKLSKAEHSSQLANPGPSSSGRSILKVKEDSSECQESSLTVVVVGDSERIVISSDDDSRCLLEGRRQKEGSNLKRETNRPPKKEATLLRNQSTRLEKALPKSFRLLGEQRKREEDGGGGSEGVIVVSDDSDEEEKTEAFIATEPQNSDPSNRTTTVRSPSNQQAGSVTVVEGESSSEEGSSNLEEEEEEEEEEEKGSDMEVCDAKDCNGDTQLDSQDPWYLVEKDILGRMVYEKNFGADGGYGAKFKKCTNCRQKGHLEFECAQPKRHQTCYICMDLNHLRIKCPYEMCGYCCQRQHRGRSCSVKVYTQCRRCGGRGHLEENCPEVWRQFHNTQNHADQLAVLKPTRAMRTDKMYCFNCGLQGHLGVHCHQRRDRMALVNSPFVQVYSADSSSRRGRRKLTPERSASFSVQTTRDPPYEASKSSPSRSPLDSRGFAPERRLSLPLRSLSGPPGILGKSPREDGLLPPPSHPLRQSSAATPPFSQQISLPQRQRQEEEDHVPHSSTPHYRHLSRPHTSNDHTLSLLPSPVPSSERRASMPSHIHPQPYRQSGYRRESLPKDTPLSWQSQRSFEAEEDFPRTPLTVHGRTTPPAQRRRTSFLDDFNPVPRQFSPPPSHPLSHHHTPLPSHPHTPHPSHHHTPLPSHHHTPHPSHHHTPLPSHHHTPLPSHHHTPLPSHHHTPLPSHSHPSQLHTSHLSHARRYSNVDDARALLRPHGKKRERDFFEGNEKWNRSSNSGSSGGGDYRSEHGFRASSQVVQERYNEHALLHRRHSNRY